MILENFREKSSDLELVWGRKTSYKVDPRIKKRNHTVHYDPVRII
jgi:hypothetical protein